MFIVWARGVTHGAPLHLLWPQLGQASVRRSRRSRSEGVDGPSDAGIVPRGRGHAAIGARDDPVKALGTPRARS